MYNFITVDSHKILEEIAEDIYELDKKLRFEQNQELFEEREDLFLLREFVETRMIYPCPIRARNISEGREI